MANVLLPLSAVAALAAAVAFAQTGTAPSGAASPGRAAGSTGAAADAALPAPGAPMPSTAPPPASQVAAGEQLAAKGAGEGVAPCSSCHGARGEGNAAGGFPRIAGQPARYLVNQLAAYADGRRTNPVMTPIAKALSPAQRESAAAYYASLDPRGASASSSGAGSRAQGAPAKAAASPATGGGRAAQLIADGDERAQVQGCANCHGPGASGEPPVYPYLASQHASYFRKAMAQWRNGSRNTDASGQMPHIAQRLTEADVAALGSYLAALPPPPPADAKLAPVRSMVPEAAVKAPSTPAASAASQPQQGTGVSGEGPTTGGAQGPGGNQPPQGNRTGSPSDVSSGGASAAGQGAGQGGAQGNAPRRP